MFIKKISEKAVAFLDQPTKKSTNALAPKSAKLYFCIDTVSQKKTGFDTTKTPCPPPVLWNLPRPDPTPIPTLLPLASGEGEGGDYTLPPKKHQKIKGGIPFRKTLCCLVFNVEIPGCKEQHVKKQSSMLKCNVHMFDGLIDQLVGLQTDLLKGISRFQECFCLAWCHDLHKDMDVSKHVSNKDRRSTSTSEMMQLLETYHGTLYINII